MIELWIGLILLTLIAMSFLFWPLLKGLNRSETVDRELENVEIFHQRLAELQLEKDQGFLTPDSFDELKLELEKNLLVDAQFSDKAPKSAMKSKVSQFSTVIVLCLLLPALSLYFYDRYGSYDQLAWNSENRANVLADSQRQPKLEEVVALLENELAKTPQNPEGWYVLAGHYMRMGAFEKGAQAFLKVTQYLEKTSPQYASVVGQYAQALFFISNKVTAEVKEQINIALSLDSQEVVSLGLLGIEAFENSNYQEAINFWQKSLINAQPSARQALLSGIEKARKELSNLSAANNEPQLTKKSKLKVVVDVEITDEVKNAVAKDATLFIFARPVAGKIPLAAVKLTVAELPKRITLDDTLAMLPSATISMHKQVEVSARVSLSGQPQLQAGDYQSQVLQVEVSSENTAHKLLIKNLVE